ncbi:hypothetical protein GCM10010336_22380 [Streptomyces goshikiensis]|nr:hypothetical protein GCM10010336_22380 [Streptomyces goshikiensis]
MAVALVRARSLAVALALLAVALALRLPVALALAVTLALAVRRAWRRAVVRWPGLPVLPFRCRPVRLVLLLTVGCVGHRGGSPACAARSGGGLAASSRMMIANTFWFLIFLSLGVP